MEYAIVVIALAVTGAASVAHATGRAYHVTKGRVAVNCLLTGGGGFEVRTAAIGGELIVQDGSSCISGVVQVDLATLETGIGLRDRHMRDTYLETGRGPVFTQARLEEICIDRAEGRTGLHAMLSLHGVRHAISGEADLQPQRGGAIQVRADFPVSLVDFGIQPPRYLGMGVNDQVQVQVTFAAIP